MHFKFCPKCSTPLEMAREHGTERPTCPSCGFIHYLNPAPAAGAVIVEGGKILLVKRAHEPAIGKWSIPAGFMEWGESPEETTIRELKEETNLEIELDGLFHVYSGDDDPRTRAVLILYFAKASRGSLVAGDDAAEARWFGVDEFPTDDKVAFESHRQALAKLRNEYSELFKA